MDKSLVRLLRRFPIAARIVLPYLILTIVLGVAGAFVVASVVADSLQARSTSVLDEAGRTAFDEINRTETSQLNVVRTVASTSGVVEALVLGDRAKVGALVATIKASQNADWIEVFDARGQRVVGLVTPPGGDPTRPQELPAGVAADRPIVREVLQGMTDQLGDKRVAMAETVEGPTLFVAGPVKNNDQIVGAVVVGSYVRDLVGRLQRPGLVDAALFWPDGRLIASTLATPGNRPLVPSDVLMSVARQGAHVQLALDASGTPLQALAQPFSLRNRVDGILLVAIPRSVVVQTGAVTQLQIALLFAGGMGLAILIGVTLARSLVQPIEQLVTTTRAVAGGDLERRSGLDGRDEIGQLASAFDHMTESLAVYTDRLGEMYLNTVKSLAAAIDAKDPYTHGHSARVADYAVRIARHLGLGETEIAHLEVGAYLHDVGKIGIADAILQKPGRLTDEEWAVMRRHPVVGAEILRPIAFPQNVMDVVMYHHERIDGRGFPRGLPGEAIPFLARIACVCDAYDAMTSNRAYRSALSTEMVLFELKKGAGVQFDPRVVEALFAILNVQPDAVADRPEPVPEPVPTARKHPILAIIE